MKKILADYFEKGEKPIALFILSIAVLIIDECLNKFVRTGILDSCSFIFYLLSTLGMILSAMYQFMKKRWRQGIITVFILGICFLTVGIYFFMAGDGFADHLKIPKDIPLEKPIDLCENKIKRDSVRAIKKKTTDFQLYSIGQPGIYGFDFWTSKIDSGIIYLKATEITEGSQLSTKYLPNRSLLQIGNPSDTIVLFSLESDFTIYEGDWGKPYAARFEVWFRQEEGGKERMLFSKNYIIEGWER